MGTQAFLGTAFTWKARLLFLPTKSNDAKWRVLHKAILRVKQYRFLLTSVSIPTSKLAKAKEDKESVSRSIKSHLIDTRLRHVDIPIYYS